MPLEKMGEFSFNHTGQQHDLYNAMGYDEIQQNFDSRAEQLKEVFNNLITVLQKVNADSGAHNIGSQAINGIAGENVHAQLVALKDLIGSLDTDKADATAVFTKTELSSTADGNSGADLLKSSPITGVPGTTVRELLQELKYQINSAVTGTIPDNSISPAKLTFDPATQQELDDAVFALQQQISSINLTAVNVSVADTAKNFTAKNVEGVLAELFTSADSVKTNVANAIGSPASKNDTGAQLAGRVTTEKGRMTGAIGDGNSSSTLQYTSDRLILRKNNIATTVGSPATTSSTLAQIDTVIQNQKNTLATNLTNKGQSSTGTETLATLAGKVANINTGKRWAEGSLSITMLSNSTTITGLGFIPSLIVFRIGTNNYFNGVLSRLSNIFLIDGSLDQWRHWGVMRSGSNFTMAYLQTDAGTINSQIIRFPSVSVGNTLYYAAFE